MNRVVFILLISFISSICWGQIVDAELLKVLERHAETLRSEIHPNGLKSLILEGTHEKKDGTVLPIEVKKEHPGKIRLETLQSNDFKVTIGYNAQSGVSWGRIDDGKRVALIDPSEKQNINWLAIDSDFDGHLIRALNGDESVTLTHLDSYQVPNSELKLHCILATDDSEQEFRYYLHPSKFYMVRKQVIPGDGSAVMEVRHSHYRLVEGIPIAHRIALYADGVHKSTENYSNVRVNEEIYDFLFEKSPY